MVAHISETSQPIIMNTKGHDKSSEKATSFFDVLDAASKNTNEEATAQKSMPKSEEDAPKADQGAEKNNETVKASDAKDEKKDTKVSSVVADYLTSNPLVMANATNTLSLDEAQSISPIVADVSTADSETSMEPVVYSSAEVVVTDYSEGEETNVVSQNPQNTKEVQAENSQVETMVVDSDVVKKDVPKDVLGNPESIKEHIMKDYSEGKITLEPDFEGNSKDATVSYKKNFVAVQRESRKSVEMSSSLDASSEVVSKASNFTSTMNVEASVSVSAKVQEIGSLGNSVVAQAVNQISNNLQNVSTFKNEFSFTVNPEHLGKIAVKMVVEDGTLTVELSASSKETQSILASNLDSIKEILKNLSTDNQVPRAQENVNPDYLEQQDNSNKGNSQNQAQNQNQDTDDDNDMPFTENFLSMLNIFNAEKI